MSISKKITLGALITASVLAFPALAQAADTQSSWRGNIVTVFPDGRTENGSMLLILAEHDGQLTGTAGPSEQQQSLVAHVSEGAQVQFDTNTADRQLHFRLRREGSQLRGNAEGQADGRKVTARVVLHAVS
jgi:hypothetical protein